MKFKKLVLIALWTVPFLLCQCGFLGDRGDGSGQNLDTLCEMDHIRNRGILIAVTNCSLLNYNMYDGKPSGFQYELLRDLCNTLNLKLELRVNDNIDSCYKMLENGDVDLLATGLSSTKRNKQRFLLSNPILMQRSVLVQRMPSKWHDMSTGDEVENQLLRSTLDLGGKTVYVPKSSSVVTQLRHLSDEIGDTIFVVEVDTLNTLDLIQMVSDKKIDYTVTEEHIAKAAARTISDIDIKLPVSFERPIVWALHNHHNDSSMLIEVNEWLDGFQQQKMRRTFYKYFKGEQNALAASNSKVKDRISDMDAEIKKVAGEIGWDWRVLASLIYQESKFIPDLESGKGAYGLMQLMPVVMERYGIDYTSSVEEQIAAGGKLIQYLEGALPESITDSVQKKLFVLASYNSGLGHVLDARRLAEKYGRDPDVWSDNVDYFMLNKSKPQYYKDSVCCNGYARGVETCNFVEDVVERYEHYQVLIQ